MFDEAIATLSKRINAAESYLRTMEEKNEEPRKKVLVTYHELKYRINFLNSANDTLRQAYSEVENDMQALTVCLWFLKGVINERSSDANHTFSRFVCSGDEKNPEKLQKLIDKLAEMNDCIEDQDEYKKQLAELMQIIVDYILFYREKYIPIERKKKK